MDIALCYLEISICTIAPQLQGYGVRSNVQTDGAFEGDIFNLFRRGCTVKWVGSAGAPLLHNLQGHSYVGGQWAVGDALMYYVMSPKDVVIAKPRKIILFMVIFVEVHL
ncbi:hypothetical protein MKX03_034552 [Papaver bracteatum]|nr:hypothetical protein MKX03_034552 [Papaver bracteatum]